MSSVINDKYKLINQYSIYVLFFIIFSPIFLSLDFSNGINFDELSGQKYNKPSVAISIFLLAILSIINIKYLMQKKELIILFVLTTIYTIANIKYGTSRVVILYIGMFLPIISYYIFINIFINYSNIYNKMYKSLVIIVVVKLILDIFINYNSYINDLTIDYNTVSFFEYLTNLDIYSEHYLIPSIKIYNFYAYFPFIYYLIIVLSVHNIINNKMIKRSIVLILISIILAIDTSSRLFIYGIYLVPILILFYYMSKFKLKTYFYLFMFIAIVITLIISFVDFNISDISLRSRYIHAHKYFEHFTISSFLLPFINQHRLNTTGSLHNELLEIFSFFGLVTVYYYYIIKNIFINVNNEYNLISYLLMFIIIIGSLIQINITNVYIGIILGMVLAIISINNVEINKEEIK